MGNKDLVPTKLDTMPKKNENTKFAEITNGLSMYNIKQSDPNPETLFTFIWRSYPIIDTCKKTNAHVYTVYHLERTRKDNKKGQNAY